MKDKCGFAEGEDRDAEDESEACGYEIDGTFDWLNHVKVEHRGEPTVDCELCGDDTGWVEKYVPKIQFFDESEHVVACLECQRRELDRLRERGGD